jgi:hypothetical protein
VGHEREEAELKYRSKLLNGDFYLQVKKPFDEFYALLAEMLHEWDTNIVEGMNKFPPSSYLKTEPTPCQ